MGVTETQTEKEEEEYEDEEPVVPDEVPDKTDDKNSQDPVKHCSSIHIQEENMGFLWPCRPTWSDICLGYCQEAEDTRGPGRGGNGQIQGGSSNAN